MDLSSGQTVLLVAAVLGALLIWRMRATTRGRANLPSRFEDIDPRSQHEIRTLVGAGRKIEAIKLLRENTNLDLRAAKDAVERMMT